MNDNWNKINTREELIILLKSYEGILNYSIINYLNSLIDLEFSVIKDYISPSDRTALSELEVYKRIAMYNIYYKALDIFKNSPTELVISGNNDEIEGLEIFAPLKGKNIKLFDFDYQEGYLGFESQIPDGYKTMHIGNISLFQTIENKEQIEAELMRVMNTLERLYNEKNLYPSNPNTYGGPAAKWAYDHQKKISEYEEKFKQLDAKKELTDAEKREIALTKHFYDLLLEDYGLTNTSFSEEKNNNSIFNIKEENQLQRTLIKKQPNLTITSHIKYI